MNEEGDDSLDDGSATFKPADELPPLPTPLDATSLVPFQLTSYEILAELGRGGMGVVYKARQINLDRLVALKMLTAGMLGSREDVVRFKTEADALAHLRHPNIVQIHEIGEKDGQPYLALEFVEGGSLAEHLAGTPVDPNIAAPFVEALARAAHFAHERKIIHRDLKPANILLDSGQIAKTDLRSAIPKITDFGLAKRLDQDSGQTRTGSIMGTPSYMAPEQAAGKLDAIGPATDVYALGAILYEMLTGRPPFRAVTPVETLQQVLYEEPVPPRRLQPGVPFDLETICLKCLAKEPAARYGSALALADDLARFQARQPILARPVSALERTLKWTRRRPALAGLIGASLIAVLLLVGLLVGAYYNGLLQESLTETQKQKKRADDFAELKRRSDYLGWMNRAHGFWEANDVPRMLSVLRTHRNDDLRSFEWHYLSGLSRSELRNYTSHGHPVHCVAISPTETLVASGGGRSTLGPSVTGVGEVHIWDLDTGKTHFILKGHTREVNAVAFSRDGKLLASGDSHKEVRLWKVATGELVAVLEGHSAAVTSVAFHPKADRLASSSRDGIIRIWDVVAKKGLYDLVNENAVVSCVAFNFDGTRLLAGGFEPRNDRGGIWEWDLATKTVVNEYREHPKMVNAVVFHPNGKSFISAGDDRAIRVWITGKKDPDRVLQRHQDRVSSLTFDKSGTRLASASADLTAIVWDLTEGKELYSRKGHTDGLRGVAFARDGARLLTASADHTIKVWKAEGQQEFAILPGHDQHVTDVAFSPDNSVLASASEDHTIRLWDVAAGKLRHVLKDHQSAVRCLVFAKDTQKAWQLLSGSDDGTVRFWNIEKAKEVFRFDVPRQHIQAVALAPVGARLAAAGVREGDFQASADITLWDIERRKIVRTLVGHGGRVTTLAFSPDGKRLVSASADARAALKIWDVADGTELASIPLEDATEPRIVWSPDGKTLAIANGDVDKGTIRILDAETGKETQTRIAHAGMAKALAFTPDGARLITTAGKRTGASQIKLFDVVTGQEVLTLPGPTGLIRCLALSPDGRRLAGGGGPVSVERGEIILWQAR